MTNADVIALVKGGFGDDLIIAKVRKAAETAFDLTTSGMLALKQASVSERVIAAMIDPEAPVAPSRDPEAPAKSEVQTTVTMGRPATRSLEGREAGIYFTAENGDDTALEPTVFSQGRTGGVFTSALTWGIKKAKWKAVVRSPKAVIRLRAAKPEFRFYFESKGAGLGNTGHMAGLLGASSPNEFVLARMTVEDDDRELIVGEFGAFGASSGTRSKDTVQLSIERVAPGTYRVSPAEPLEPGEYCFFYAAGASAFAASGHGKLFDFGVD